MEFLKASRRRNYLSEVLHIALNVALAAMLFVLVYTGSMLLAFLLVIVSKWRIMAVRPRYWWANILANIVDVTVSLSAVCLLYLAGTAPEYSLALQVGIAVLYALWLVVIKPRSSRAWLTVQAGTGLLLGVWALLAFAHVMPDSSIAVLGSFVVAYGAARHVLAGREEIELSLLSMMFGLLVAQVVWVASYWTVAYGAIMLGGLQLPQAAIVVTLLGFLMLRVYDAFRAKKSFLSVDIIAPAVFVVLVVFIMAIFFRSGAGIV